MAGDPLEVLLVVDRPQPTSLGEEAVGEDAAECGHGQGDPMPSPLESGDLCTGCLHGDVQRGQCRSQASVEITTIADPALGQSRELADEGDH